MAKNFLRQLYGELEAAEAVPGLLMLDILEMPDALRDLMNWMLRRKGVELEELATHLEQKPEKVSSFVNQLIQKGFIEVVDIGDGFFYYRVRTRGGTPKKRPTSTDIWDPVDTEEQ